MRILAISYALPPMLFPQAVQIGRLLSSIHAEVGAVSADIAGRSTDLDTLPAFDARLAFRLKVPNRRVLSGFAADMGRRFLPLYARIPDECRGWVKPAEAAVRAKLQAGDFRPDVTVTFGEPMSDHVLGLRLRRVVRAPWIAHFSDPWADNPFRRYNFLANVVNRRLERRVIRNADHLIFTSQETVDLVMRKYPSAWRQKCSLLPHSFDATLYPRRTEAGTQLTARFIGNFYGHRTPLPLYRALRVILGERPDILGGVRFELVGQMPWRMRHHPAFLALPQGLVRLVGSVPHSQALKLMVDADLLLVIDGPSALSVFLPSKLVEYLGAGVPICGIVPPGASAKLLRRMGTAVADPDDVAGAAQALAQSLCLARERRARGAATPWGDQSVRQEFERDRVARLFAEIVGRVVQQGKADPSRGGAEEGEA